MGSPNSDPFDDDDDFFADVDLAELDEYEAQAISATQAGPTIADVSQPRVGQNKVPRPINTEPRAGGKSTFGFGEGGKNGHSANQARFIDNAQKRKEYWGIRRDGDEEADVPAVTIDATGRYGLLAEPVDEEDEGVVDLHAPGGSSHAFSRRRLLASAAPTSSQGALARRMAIAQATRDIAKVPSPTNTVHSAERHIPVSAVPRPNTQTARVLSRSVSVGNQVFGPSSLRGSSSNMAAIPTQQPPIALPDSQGSQLRRSVLELDEQRRQRSELEEKVHTLSRQLADAHRSNGHRHWADNLAVGPLTTQDQMKELQSEVWRAKGEAETMRRNQREETQRHLAEADRLRQRIGEMEKIIADREKENAAHIENVKSQAIFATHAAFNSTGKGRARASSTLRPGTPNGSQGGSPQHRAGGLATNAFRKPVPRKSPQKAGGTTGNVRFGGLQNAFSADMRVKRAGTRFPDVHGAQGIQHRGDQSDVAEGHETNTASGLNDAMAGGSHGYRLSSPPDAATAESPSSTDPDTYEIKRRTQFLHHMLNHTTASFNATCGELQPDIYRVFQHQPALESDEYRECCSDLLRVCADHEASLIEIAAIMITALSRIYALIVQSKLDLERSNDSALLRSILGLLTSTCLLFGDQTSIDNRQALAKTNRLLLDRHFRKPAKLGHKPTGCALSRPEQRGRRAVCQGLLALSQVLAWTSDICVWTGDDLALIISVLAHPSQDAATVLQSIKLFRVAACSPRNFRALVATAADIPVSDHDTTPLMLPVVETMCRYLVTPHRQWSPRDIAWAHSTIIRALSMLCSSGPDAIVLVAARSSIIPAIVVLLGHQSEHLLGLEDLALDQRKDTIQTISTALFLLHHIVYPVPMLSKSLRKASVLSLSQHGEKTVALDPPRDQEVHNIQGVDLQARLLSASSAKEWTGLQHIFLRTLGSLAYCEPLESHSPAMLAETAEIAISESALRWRTIQYLSQDLLESVVEGPEADEIYEMYFNGEAAAAIEPMDVDEETDEDGYAAMRDVVIE